MEARVARMPARLSSRWRTNTTSARAATTSAISRARARPRIPSGPRFLSHGKNTRDSERRRSMASSSLHEVVHLNEREEDRDGDEPDRAPHEDHHERLEQ